MKIKQGDKICALIFKFLQENQMVLYLIYLKLKVKRYYYRNNIEFLDVVFVI